MWLVGALSRLLARAVGPALLLLLVLVVLFFWRLSYHPIAVLCGATVGWVVFSLAAELWPPIPRRRPRGPAALRAYLWLTASIDRVPLGIVHVTGPVRLVCTKERGAWNVARAEVGEHDEAILIEQFTVARRTPMVLRRLVSDQRPEPARLRDRVQAARLELRMGTMFATVEEITVLADQIREATPILELPDT